MFNLQGSEIIFILLIALVVLGPEKLPGAIRRATQMYAELRKMGTGFQTEFKSALDEPMREMRETADLIKETADPKKMVAEAERDANASLAAERAAEADIDVAADDAVDMSSNGAVDVSSNGALTTDRVDEWDDPVDDPVPDAPDAPGAPDAPVEWSAPAGAAVPDDPSKPWPQPDPGERSSTGETSR